MILIKSPKSIKHSRNREIKLSANCAEVLKFLISCAEEPKTYWVNRPFITESINMPARDVYASLIGLQRVGLVMKKEGHQFYRFISQDNEIKFEEY